MRMSLFWVLIVAVVLIYSTFGATLLWIIAGLSFAALVILIVVMARADTFVGPKVLVEDVRERLEALGRDDADDRDEVLVIREDNR